MWTRTYRSDEQTKVELYVFIHTDVFKRMISECLLPFWQADILYLLLTCGSMLYLHPLL
jgi:hypothetical protein